MSHFDRRIFTEEKPSFAEKFAWFLAGVFLFLGALAAMLEYFDVLIP